MNQALMKEIKDLVIANRLKTTEEINNDLVAALDQLILDNKIFDYTMTIEAIRISVSVKKTENSVFYAFQVSRT